MNLTMNYFLNVEEIMERKTEKITFDEKTSLEDILEKNISSEKLKKIKELQLIITQNGKSCESLNVIVNNGDVFCICPAIYGG